MVLLFILLGSLTVMNMLLGVLVEAAARPLPREKRLAHQVKTVSTIEKEQMVAEFARRAARERSASVFRAGSGACVCIMYHDSPYQTLSL